MAQHIPHPLTTLLKPLLLASQHASLLTLTQQLLTTTTTTTGTPQPPHHHAALLFYQAQAQELSALSLSDLDKRKVEILEQAAATYNHAWEVMPKAPNEPNPALGRAMYDFEAKAKVGLSNVGKRVKGVRSQTPGPSILEGSAGVAGIVRRKIPKLEKDKGLPPLAREEKQEREQRRREGCVPWEYTDRGSLAVLMKYDTLAEWEGKGYTDAASLEMLEKVYLAPPPPAPAPPTKPRAVSITFEPKAIVWSEGRVAQRHQSRLMEFRRMLMEKFYEMHRLAEEMKTVQLKRYELLGKRRVCSAEGAAACKVEAGKGEADGVDVQRLVEAKQAERRQRMMRLKAQGWRSRRFEHEHVQRVRRLCREASKEMMMG
jgi:hypothetical protein